MPAVTQLSSDETTLLRIIAQDPTVKVGRKILTALVPVPAEILQKGPWGHRVHVVDYDASRRLLYTPIDISRDKRGRVKDRFAKVADRVLLADPGFHQQNAYAIVMRTLATFERVLGRRLSWGFGAHQLKVVPHAFEDANAFYSEDDYGLYFGYFSGPQGPVFTCLSHDVVVHETAHALLDGLRQRFTDPSSPDQAAFHEGFADMVALLSVFQLPEVISELLSRARQARSKHRISRKVLQDQQFVRNVLFGLGEQLGSELYKLPGRALRISYSKRGNPRAYESLPEFQETYRRGEILVAAMLHAFVEVWQARLAPSDPSDQTPLDRQRVVEEGAAAAEHLLNMAIRGLDYTPPVHLTFRDYLSAVLTADREVQPDDSRYQYRQRLRKSFASWGIAPSSRRPNSRRGEMAPPEPGAWCAMDSSWFSYSGVHQDAMRRDPDEMFRFIWQNRYALRLHPEAYSRVLSVRPCRRLAPDGAPVQETVVEFYQIWEPTQRELRALGLSDADGTAELLEGIKLYGGGTLIFDDFGRLKYHIHNSVRNIPMQKARLNYLLSSPLRRVTPVQRFAELHRLRAADPSKLTLADRW